MNAGSGKGRLLVLYHFFHPDDVVSARHFSDLATEQQSRGWRVTALTSNRVCREPGRTLPERETWRGIDVVRVGRPAWNQALPAARLGNSAWMVARWIAAAARLGPFDAVIVGSDPAFAPLVFPALRAVWPRAALVHWCFDLYPEAIEVDGVGGALRAAMPIGRAMMKAAYAACDALVDLGPRMRERLAKYGARATAETIVPWALVEPRASEAPDERVRHELFGNAALGLLYSGTMGRAHDYQALLALARECRRRVGDAIAVTFACRGNKADELRAQLRPDDTNVRLAGFCPEEELGARLAAADVHLLSLRHEWSGIVVPSKFFGSLASFRPTVYAGAGDSDVARWIRELDVGIAMDESGVDAAASALVALQNEPGRRRTWQERAGAAYRARFSRACGNDAFDRLLDRLVARR